MRVVAVVAVIAVPSAVAVTTTVSSVSDASEATAPATTPAASLLVAQHASHAVPSGATAMAAIEVCAATATPVASLLATLFVGEKSLADKHCTLRVVLAHPTPAVIMVVQINGFSQGQGRPADYPHLFPEPYDQKPPELAQSHDFTVRSVDLKYGANEVAVLVSAPVTVNSIELAVEAKPRV